jgi:outer membrane protein OmpA-like peptidoglycan-associated protein
MSVELPARIAFYCRLTAALCSMICGSIGSAHSESPRSQEALNEPRAAIVRYCKPRPEDSADKSTVSDQQLQSLREQYQSPSAVPFAGLSKEELNVVAEALRVGSSAGYFAHRILRDLVIVKEMERLSKCSPEENCNTTTDIQEIHASNNPNGPWSQSLELWKSVTKTDIQGGKACVSIAQSMSTYSVSANLAKSDIDRKNQRETEIKKPDAPSDCREDLIEATRRATIKFSKSEYSILPKYQPIVTDIARILNRCKALTIAIEGYADIDGSIKYNQLLSEQRAAAVVAAFASNGIDAQRLKPKGFGKSRQKQPDGRQTFDHKEENRRVEIVSR